MKLLRIPSSGQLLKMLARRRAALTRTQLEEKVRPSPEFVARYVQGEQALVKGTLSSPVIYSTTSL